MVMPEILSFFKAFLNEYILEAVNGIRVTDVFDILILAFILYFLYIFIRDRRAGKLAVGFLLMIALYFISSALDMYALKLIFDNFYQVGILAIFIVFQPELRAALEKVGGTPLSGLKNITSDTGRLAALNAEIESVCDSAAALSRDKVGALMVIERTTKLGEYIKSGVIVDAAISPYVIRNIFFDKAPLHDGAVIIRDGRIHAAGCFLPLSTNYDIDKDLGTRHRAAIGMSEASDAVVIVVSEENGVISMAVNGSLKRNYNYNTLKQELNTLLAPQHQADHLRGKTKKEKKK